MGERIDQPAPEPDRPFPSEAEWLELPLPSPAELGTGPGPAFVDAVLAAVRTDRELDAALAAADQKLDRGLLAAHEAPAPGPDFVERTLQALHEDRRQHWQQLLARHVAPSPSPQFVARTLAALAGSADDAVKRRRPAPAHDRRGRWTSLVAAAAIVALAFTLFWPRSTPVPLELRLARAASPAFAHGNSASPLAALLTESSRAGDPDALIPASADGAWLLFGAGR